MIVMNLPLTAGRHHLQTFSELGQTDKAMECLQKALVVDERYILPR